MPGADEAVQAEIRRVEDRLDGREDDDMIAEGREVFDFLLSGLQDRQCRGWHRGLKPDGHEDYLFVWILPCYLQGIKGRIHHADVCPSGTGLKERVPAARHPHHVPK